MTNWPIRRHLRRCLGLRWNGVKLTISVITTFTKVQVPISIKKIFEIFLNFFFEIFFKFFSKFFKKFPPSPKKFNFKQLFFGQKTIAKRYMGWNLKFWALGGSIIDFSKNLKLTQKNLQKPVFWGYFIFFKILSKNSLYSVFWRYFK